MSKSQLRAVEQLDTLERPTVSEIDALKLENALLRVEGLQLHLQSRQAELHALAKSLERPLWVLQRVSEGTWVYQPAPPAKEP
jgi:hypothetical protein